LRGTGPARPRDAGPYDTDYEAARSRSGHSGTGPFSAAHQGPQREKPAIDCQQDRLDRAAAYFSRNHGPFGQHGGFGLRCGRVAFPRFDRRSDQSAPSNRLTLSTTVRSLPPPDPTSPPNPLENMIFRASWIRLVEGWW